MITEQQFTEAMERAVAKRGAEWRYPLPDGTATPGFYVGGAPTYRDFEGNATCLIGAAMHELGLTLPIPHAMSASALSVLGGYIDNDVAMAARAAQVHQDKFFTWGSSLNVYKAALSIQKKMRYSMFEAMELYRQATRVVGGTRTLDEIGVATAKANAAFEELGQMATATTGTITGMAVGGFYTSAVSATFGPITMASMQKLTGATSITFAEPVYMPTKAEHALIA